MSKATWNRTLALEWTEKVTFDEYITLYCTIAGAYTLTPPVQCALGTRQLPELGGQAALLPSVTSSSASGLLPFCRAVASAAETQTDN